MYLFDKDGKIRQYKTAEEILDYYYDIRIRKIQFKKTKDD